ncbi:hypothetical protein O1L68_40270 [Streptomyces lydicus]|nr:hypothetical protein [Streptomyces lydicus]
MSQGPSDEQMMVRRGGAEAQHTARVWALHDMTALLRADPLWVLPPGSSRTHRRLYARAVKRAKSS